MKYNDSKSYHRNTNPTNKRFTKYVNNYNSRTDIVNKEFFKGVKRCDLQAISTIPRVNKRFIKYIKKGHLQNIVSMIKGGFDASNVNDAALKLSAEMGNLDIVIELLKCNIRGRICKDTILRHIVRRDWPKILIALLKKEPSMCAEYDWTLRAATIYNNLNIIAILLEYGVDVHCNNDNLLINLSRNFNEELASVILPYCCEDVYHYFPTDYIERNVMPTKSANKN